MNLKEAFRYQNFLDRLLIENNGVLGSQANLLEVTRLHRRNKSNASAEDETETVEVPELIEPEVSLKFGLPVIGWVITLVAMRDCPLTKEEMVCVQKRIAEKKAAAQAAFFAEHLK